MILCSDLFCSFTKKAVNIKNSRENSDMDYFQVIFLPTARYWVMTYKNRPYTEQFPPFIRRRKKQK